jgi:hypothetical protein
MRLSLERISLLHRARHQMMFVIVIRDLNLTGTFLPIEEFRTVLIALDSAYLQMQIERENLSEATPISVVTLIRDTRTDNHLTVEM